MAAVELDPIFVKALKLLQSKSKESGPQLKAMLDDVIAQRKGLKPVSHAGDFDSKSNKVKGDSDSKRKDAEKRALEKGPKDAAEPDVKKSKLDQSSKQKEKEGREKERERLKKEKEKKEEAQRERDRAEKERKEKEEASKQEAEIISDDDEPTQSMDAGDFARDLGINCVVCRQFDVSSGNQLVECQECHSLYHQECHKPPVTGQDVSDPRFVWYCSRCTKSFKKMMAQKPVKPVKPNTLLSSTIKESTSSISKNNKTESDTGSQAFRRIDPKAIVTPKDPGTSKGMVGLAGLAANLTKPRSESKISSSLKKSEHKGDNSKSLSGHKLESKTNSSAKLETGNKPSLSSSNKNENRKTDSNTKSSTANKEEQGKDAKKSELSKTKTEEKKSTESSSSSSSKKEDKKEKSESSSGKSSSKDDKKSESRSKSHMSSPGSGSAATGSNSPSSGESGGGSGSKNSNKQAMANLSMVTANKRIQMMKKKAQTKPQEKIVHIK